MTTRTLRDWADIAEIAGGIAIILSLIYVGYEIRQNTLAMESNSRQQFAEQDLAYLATALDPVVVAVALAKLEAGEDLSNTEHSQLVHRQHMNFRIFENALYQYQKGMLEYREWERYKIIINLVICKDVTAQAMWLRFEGAFVPEFRETVNDMRDTCM